jgi:hypothetical protein
MLETVFYLKVLISNLTPILFWYLPYFNCEKLSVF